MDQKETKRAAARARTRVAFINETQKIGGAEINLLNLVQRLEPSRFQPIVLLPPSGPLGDRLREFGTASIVIPRARLFSTSFYVGHWKVLNPFAFLVDMVVVLSQTLRIRRALLKEKVDIVHTNTLLAHFYGGMAARLARIPCIWHVQDIVSPSTAGGLFLHLLRVMARWIPKRVVAVSASTAEMFAECTPAKVSVIPNGTDPDRFSPYVNAEAVRRELKIGPEERIVGMVGRITPWKGHREFLRAASLVLKSNARVRFLIVGDATFGHGGYVQSLRQLTVEMGIDARMMFVGAQNDVPPWIRAMDILVHASVSPEPFGLVVIEGMACGVPVIASCLGGPSEIIEDGVDGLLVDPREPRSLAEAIQRLVDDEPLRRRLGASARQKVLAKYAIATFVKSFEELYTDLQNNRTG
jgi:glycosyltransferase involved in cell wall biosynthesis